MRAPVPSPVFDTYWRFAAARQELFFARLEQPASRSWTADPILARYKFCNAYRAADRTSQYLLRHVIYEGSQEPLEVFFRTLAFKFFNKIETWRLLQGALGELSWGSYRRQRWDDVLSGAMEKGQAVFSGAYIMPTAQAFGETGKHRNFLALLERMMQDELPERLARADSLRQVYEQLLAYPLIGEFLGFQYAIDLNYGPLIDFPEADFVVAGPGALSGLGKCFLDTGGMTPEELIHWTTDQQEQQFQRLGLTFRPLFGRRLQPIDCQNLYCETNKYSRVAHPDVPGLDGRTRIKQAFQPNRSAIPYFFPPKWGLKVPEPATVQPPVEPDQAELFELT